MKTTRFLKAWFLAGLVAMAGSSVTACYNASMYRTAVPLKKGQVAAGVGGGYVGFPASHTLKDKKAGADDNTVEIPYWTLPYNDYFVRVGLGSQLDIGFKYSVPTGFELDLKGRIIHVGRFSLALDPGVEFSTWIVLHRFVADLPILASIDVTRYFKIYGGARFFYSYWGSSVDDEFDADLKNANALSYGGFLGLSFEIDISGVTLFIRPEFHYYRMQFVHYKNTFNWIQPGIGIGVRFGGPAKRPRRPVQLQPVAPQYQQAPPPQQPSPQQPGPAAAPPAPNQQQPGQQEQTPPPVPPAQNPPPPAPTGTI
ncbi:MAG: hypothetical protein J7M25_05905 [Deltaproteobacteria bacterium]|nr:hypothetical protein [Deltaproteobacteria bacterium]